MLSRDLMMRLYTKNKSKGVWYSDEPVSYFVKNKVESLQTSQSGSRTIAAITHRA
jgi:hypothetical protein